SRVPPGASVLRLADPVDEEKARQFLLALQSRKATFDWEITVRWQGELTPLHFAGGQVESGFLVVTALSRDSLALVNEELMRINNEQTNALRSTAKELAALGRSRPERDGLFDKLTRVNNDLANLQRELAKKNFELAKLNEQKNLFLGIAAHDLRSPLGVILTYSEFLEAEVGPTLTVESRAFVSIIKDTSEFLLRLIDDLLDVSQIESGKLNLNLQPTSLTELVSHSVALNRLLAEKKQIRMVFVADAILPTLLIDPGKLDQVLYNLLTNAVKFSYPHTEISVRLTRESEHAVITVTDQGQGIPAAELEKLFKPFSRTRVRSTGGEASTGLGLSIVHRIVEGHHGTVSVKSVVGKGSSFEVRLPLIEPAGGANSSSCYGPS
ncbi:MAG: putative Histidine kinase, partial [Chthoniobacteraceae bacterium]|nr:putative Histidine kinase [Chthoniobacteraceae bacterium]